MLLPPTSPALRDDDARVGDLRRHLMSPDLEERGYWLGALLRDSRDVWLYATPVEIRENWDHVMPHLGRSRAMWAWLPGLPEPEWPPKDRS